MHKATLSFNSYRPHFLTIVFIALLGACSSPTKTKETTEAPEKEVATEQPTIDTTAESTPPTAEQETVWEELPDSALIRLSDWDSSFVLDVKYASTDNFTGKVLYDCETCLIRKVAAEALIKAQEKFENEGYSLKIFDCYRPHSVQKKMWEMVPDPRYVADPAKGSMHNRGLAVDISLIDKSTGEELAMGSPYDHFGNISHHGYTDLPDAVLANREYLKSSMIAFGFEPITSEWWHYSFRDQFYAVSDEPLSCP